MLGLLPMALSTDIGSEAQKPLAVMVIGGLISAALLTLIVLPTLYLVFHKLRLPNARRAAGGGRGPESPAHPPAGRMCSTMHAFLAAWTLETSAT